jgi:hypothetical protein
MLEMAVSWKKCAAALPAGSLPHRGEVEAWRVEHGGGALPWKPVKQR